MEGPSIHLLAQELQLLVGQKIKKASGNASFEKKILLDQTINEIYPFGKRLIIQLDSHALVIHFLMYGSYRVDEQRKGMNPRLELITSQHAFALYNCSVKCIKRVNLKKYIPFAFDILWPTWNIVKVINIIKRHRTSTIDDILLDQNIFAGVGNIIKNEALFLSKVRPEKKISQLSLKKLKEIANNTRKFSQRFLELRKIFQLKKNLQIYRKTLCPTCGTKIIRKKTGKLQRWSFYCPKCQKYFDQEGYHQ